MAYNVKLQPVQTIIAPGAVGIALDYTNTFIPDTDRGVPFFISVYNSGASNVFVVRTGEASSGIYAAAGESVSAGPFLLQEADGIIELFFDAPGQAEVSFLSVLEEI